MKFIVAILALAAVVVAVNGSYVPSVVSYSTAVPAAITSSSVWPAYGGLYGKAVASYATYPGTYGNWPLYGKASWGYSAAPVVIKVVDNGLWNYGGFNKYWL